MNKPYKFKLWHILLVPFLPFILIYYIAVSKKIPTTSKLIYTFLIVFGLLLIYLLAPKLQDIKISANNNSLFFEENGTLLVEFIPNDQGNLDLLKCESSDTNVVTIANLKIITKGEGQAKITCSYNNITSNEIIIEVNLTNQQKLDKRLNTLIEKTGDIGYSRLITPDVNYPIELIEDIAKVYEKYDLGNIKAAGGIVDENGRQMTGIFTEKNGAFKIYVHNNKMESMEDMKGEVIYLVGNIIDNYILQTDVERKLSLIVSDVKKEVKKGLLYPKSAEFIDIKSLDNSSWTFFWKHGYLSVASVVRSENVFGGVVAKPFIVQFIFIEDVFFPTYVGIGDAWSEGEYVEHTD